MGIGNATAKVLASAGAHVVCAARSDDKLRELSKNINQNKKGSANSIICDVSDTQSILNAVKITIEKYNKIDILVNNAGITRDSLLMRMRQEDWDSVMETNLKAAFTSTKAVLKSMIKNRSGRIINISSIVGITGNAGQANYAASKAGLIGMTKSIAKEVASRSITVNCVSPGWIKTSMTDDITENSKSNLIKRIPQGKAGVPENIAHTVLFLASNEASYITGQTIAVDGGRIIN